MRLILKAVFILLLLLVAVLIARTLMSHSRQMAVTPPAQPAIDADRAAGHLASAIRCRTITYDEQSTPATEEFDKLHQFLESTYPNLHRVLKREMFGSSLLYTWQGSDTSLPPILLAAHQDVVPVQPGSEGQWEHPPFDGQIAGGYVWGRGSLDDKGSLIAIMEAVDHLAAAGFQPRRTVYLGFGHDEEGEGAHGAAVLAKVLADRGVKLDFATDEGSFVLSGAVPGVSVPTALVAVGEKGYLNIEISADGTGGHSSMPPAHTAAGVLAAAIEDVENHPMPARLHPVTRTLLEDLGPEMPFGQHLVMSNLWLLQPLVIHMFSSGGGAQVRTTTAVTMLQASNKSNALPTRASAVVNFRIMPGDHMADVVAHVRQVIRDPQVHVKSMGGNEAPPVSDLGTPEGQAFTRTLREVFPDAVVAPFISTGATDGRYYTPLTPNVFRMAPFRTGMDVTARMHGTNERVAVKGLAEATQFYIRLLQNTVR